MRKESLTLAQGVYAALVTPRRPDSIEVDTAAYLEYLDKVSAAGVDGLVFFGSTGEFVHFNTDERMRVVGLAVRRSRIPVLVNVSHSTSVGVRDLADHAMDSGAHGVLIMPPYYYRYGDDEIAEFYDGVCTSMQGRVPVYLYQIPQFTSPIAVELQRRMLASGQFAGIKDSSGNWAAFEQLLAFRRTSQFQLLGGHERILFEAWRAGADGAVSGVAAALPELPVALKAAVSAGDMEYAERLNTHLQALVTWIDRLPTTVVIKEVAVGRGWLRKGAAEPLTQNFHPTRNRFREWLGSWLPATLELCAHKPQGTSSKTR